MDEIEAAIRGQLLESMVEGTPDVGDAPALSNNQNHAQQNTAPIQRDIVEDFG